MEYVNASYRGYYRRIPSFPNHQVTTNEQVWSLKRKKFIKPFVGKEGLFKVFLYDDRGKRKCRDYKELMEETFTTPPNNDDNLLIL